MSEMKKLAIALILVAVLVLIFGEAVQAEEPVHVYFSTSGLPAGQSISVECTYTNNGGHVGPGSVTFNSPGPSSTYLNTGPDSSFSFTFPSSLTVDGAIYEFVSADHTNPFTTGASESVITVTATYSTHKYTLTVGDSENGTTSPSGVNSYNSGSVVAISASPNPGYYFSEWTGDVGTVVDVLASSTTITMNGNYSIRANFAEAPLSNDATLSSLVVSNGTLIPNFAPETTAYTTTVANNVDSITVTPTVNESHANITVNGHTATSGSSYGPIDLDIGNNIITILVTAQDTTTTQIYTLTVTRSNPTSEGGGDGDGGGGGFETPGVTRLIEYTTDDGRFIIDIAVESADGKANLNIPTDTIGYDSNGQRLAYISIKENTSPPAPPADREYVCLTYDIGPSGATFYPPISLTINYSDSQIPEGVAEEDLVLATLQDGQWVEFENCVVDPVNNFITVAINHFSTFVAMAHTAPARFEINNITVTPTEVNSDETVTVSATISNTGDLSGSYSVVFKMNDLTRETKTLTLGGGLSQTVSFEVKPTTSGVYGVDVNGLSGMFNVKIPIPEGTMPEVPPTPAIFTISDFSVIPTEVNPSEEVTISAVVNNIGGSTGNYSVVLKINDETESQKEISLDPGKSKVVSFTITRNVAGSYTIDINGESQQFIVKSPPPLQISGIALIEEQAPATTSWYWLLGIICGVIITGLLIYFLFLRTRVGRPLHLSY